MEIAPISAIEQNTGIYRPIIAAVLAHFPQGPPFICPEILCSSYQYLGTGEGETGIDLGHLFCSVVDESNGGTCF